MTKKNPNVEMIQLPVGISGVGRAGDWIISDPDHPDPRYKLSIVTPIDVEHLPKIKEMVLQSEDASPEKAVAS